MAMPRALGTTSAADPRGSLTSASTYYLHRAHLGSPAALIDGNQQLVEQQAFECISSNAFVVSSNGETAMQIHHLGYRVKGFYWLARSGQSMPMITIAEQRLKMLQFWKRHGAEATMEARQVSLRALQRWARAYKDADGAPAALIPGSRAPKRRRRRNGHPEVVKKIRRLRRQHPNMGKQPLRALLEPWRRRFQLPLPSPSTIGRIIAADLDKMRANTRVQGNGPSACLTGYASTTGIVPTPASGISHPLVGQVFP